MHQSRWWIAFAPYAVVSVIHVASRYVMPGIEYPTKLMLMPLLALAAVLVAVWERRVDVSVTILLLIGVGASWLGDGSGWFFPMFDDELPMMLLSFGVAHLVYMFLFSRYPGRIRVSVLTGYAVVYTVLMCVLAPNTGSLMIPVFLYGLVLVGTAVLSTRVSSVTAWGGLLFLASDAILAFRLFMPEVLPSWAGSLVMVTYTLGQGLIVFGVLNAKSRGATRGRTTAPSRNARI